ncbi:MAG: hypothetical protein RIS26_129 [Actinomycetota bacterium]|jgi:uncharacterized membrane protein
MPRCDTYWVSNIRTNDDFVDSPSKSFAWYSILFGILGWFAAFSLTLERLHVAADPNATLSCDMNIFISCKSVMLTEQARLFGFPNPLIGLAGFVAPIAVGVAVLAGGRFKSWFWRVYLIGLSMGFVFVLWLFTQSTYVIHVLCPYCMVAWIAMIPLFWKTFIWAGAEGVIDVPVRAVGWFVRAQDFTWLFTLGTEALALLAIIFSFWNSWHLLFS